MINFRDNAALARSGHWRSLRSSPESTNKTNLVASLTCLWEAAHTLTAAGAVAADQNWDTAEAAGFGHGRLQVAVGAVWIRAAPRTRLWILGLVLGAALAAVCRPAVFQSAWGRQTALQKNSFISLACHKNMINITWRSAVSAVCCYTSRPPESWKTCRLLLNRRDLLRQSRQLNLCSFIQYRLY